MFVEGEEDATGKKKRKTMGSDVVRDMRVEIKEAHLRYLVNLFSLFVDLRSIFNGVYEVWTMNILNCGRFMVIIVHCGIISYDYLYPIIKTVFVDTSISSLIGVVIIMTVIVIVMIFIMIVIIIACYCEHIPLISAFQSIKTRGRHSADWQPHLNLDVKDVVIQTTDKNWKVVNLSSVSVDN